MWAKIFLDDFHQVTVQATFCFDHTKYVVKASKEVLHDEETVRAVVNLTLPLRIVLLRTVIRIFDK
jgi:hypothetical protein